MQPPSYFLSLNNGNTKEMVDGTSTRTRTYYFRRCKRVRWSFIQCIPDELLFEILVRLPAQDIYYGATLVCPKWHHLTRTKYFIHQHLLHASYGLLYMDEMGNYAFMSTRQDGGVSVQTYKVNYHYKTRNPVWSSWNGLILECEHCSGNLIYYVTNVSTNQVLRLPQSPFPVYLYAFCGIGYDAVSMTYKVVVTFRESLDQLYKCGCGILTLGVDKSWRLVRTDHLSDLGRYTLLSFPIITEGFVHWERSFRGNNVVTLNLETEVMTETPPPVIPKVEKKEIIRSRCLSTGSHLSLFLQRGKLEWEVFEMKPETGEWRKLCNICLVGQEGRIMERVGFHLTDDVNITPYGWLKYPEVLALRVQYTSIIFYNLGTCEIGAQKLSIFKGFKQVTLHKNSLVWL